MTKKKKLLIWALVLFAVVSNILVFGLIKNEDAGGADAVLQLYFESDTPDEYQLFYGDEAAFDEAHSSKAALKNAGAPEQLAFGLNAGAEYLRLDFGSWSANIKIQRMSLKAMGISFDIPLDVLADCVETHDIASVGTDGGEIAIKTNGGDSYIVFTADTSEFIERVQGKMNDKGLMVRILLCVVIDIAAVVLIMNTRAVFDMGINIVYDRKLIFNLAKSDFKTKYAGSYFGIIWAFVQPVIMMLVYWFALDIGLRSGETMSHPFVLWLMCGLVPWFFFSEALGSGTNALTEYSYLVKKVVFKIDILPIVKIISAIFVHLFFVALIVLLHACYGYYPDLYSLQLIYYIICMFVFVLALTYITSSIVVFFKDLNQIITIILQVGIWATPIMWDAANISARVDTVMKINPVYYVVSGFRDALLDKVWFWEKPVWTICFWAVVVVLYVIGRNVFRRLQIHFADVL